MFKDLTGKQVQVTVAFATTIGQQAALPAIYSGKLVSANTDYIEINVEDSKLAAGTGAQNMSKMMGGIFGEGITTLGGDVKGRMIIRNQFVISILEL